ncbi:type II/IV secretion system protein [Candidatus Uhrbacteria bacterium]|nr:type II/IV secretion system protein [Candidatus Uhrbacteria bacterium]
MSDGFGSISDLIKKPATPSGTGKAQSDQTHEKYEEKMKEIASKDLERRAEEKAEELSLPYMNLHSFPIGPETLALVPEETVTELRCVAFYRSAKEIKIGAVDPANQGVADFVRQLEEKTYVLVSLYVISEESLARAQKLYDTLPKIRRIVTGVEISEADLEKYKKELGNFHDLQNKIGAVSITDMVTMIIAGAVNVRSSDIHVEAEEKDIKVRYRIDGILNDAAALPKDAWPKLIARVKLLAGLKLNITDKPQDGRFTIHLTNDKIDVRVSVLPTSYGESIVIRLLMATTKGFAFDDLGIRGKAYEQLKKEIARPNGMIVTTGPTGSGKTTTLYSILTQLNTADTKIITIEDPIEYQLKGINQSQVEPSRGYTFSNGLRSIVRQDPDVILVGEIRDLETAEISIQAALTGHLVLSTIHTNSAAGTIPRFLSMGTKPFLLAPAMNAMIGQRLVRRICSECKMEDTLAPELIERIKQTLAAIPKDNSTPVALDALKFWKGKGCAVCHDIGYKGRVGIYEIMIMNKEIEKMLLGGNISEYDMQDIAVKNGMVTMLQDGLLKALDGFTTPEEVFRVAE